MKGGDEKGDKKPYFGNRYYAFGMQVAATFAIYVLGGWWLDTKFDTLPLFLIIGIVFAFISFIYFMKKLYSGN